jgi:hypothetical protein
VYTFINAEGMARSGNRIKKMTQLFNTQNTQGYTQEELAELNAEWENIVKKKGLEKFTDEYKEAAQNFSDEVARR